MTTTIFIPLVFAVAMFASGVYPLHAGWNSIAFDVEMPSMTSSTLMQMVAEQGGSPRMMDTWESGGWKVDVYPPIPIDTSFPITVGVGYMLLVDQDSVLTIHNKHVHCPFRIGVSEEWSFVGFPCVKNKDTIQDMLSQLGCYQAARFDVATNSFVGYTSGNPDPFDVSPHKGYFIRGCSPNDGCKKYFRRLLISHPVHFVQ